MLRNVKGFTLIELMIVALIIGILAAIAIPNFVSMQDRAKEGAVKSNMHTLQLAIEDYAVQNDGVYPADGTDGAAVVLLLPGGVAPNDPFDGVAATITWDADPAGTGDMGVNPANTTDYVIKGYGKAGVLTLLLSNQ